MKKKYWITWHHQARSRFLAKEFNLELKECFYNKNVFQRHFYSFFWTINILRKGKPDVIFIQLSFLLSILTVLYKKLSSKEIRVIADCHTKALRRTATGFLGNIFWEVKKWTFRNIDYSIVSNDGMKSDIETLTVNYWILPDKIPDFQMTEKTNQDLYCVYISSFAVDEPIKEIVEMARLLPTKITVYWTGKKPDSVILENPPSNLKLTGYTSYEDYVNLITNSQCIIGLTTEDDCLQSGAYEALGVEVPMVLTDSEALRSFFGDSAIYTDHKPEKIAKAIMEVMENKEEMMPKLQRIKTLRNAEFDELKKTIVEYVNN
ncbi:MAG: hypothetical protein K9J12_08655 [Melioribacteraceae bacterium]|nr:hypothetical protein [Melioribacteraceae bacterium]MCF8264204.1 hypothetical protein [Melioribacteraceae bacterium]MCF8431724.1 hypothetical protein [Melioribacteraceae bacterium]